jgi:hypothetical protein
LWAFIAIFFLAVPRRPVEAAQYANEQFQRSMANNGVTCSMTRSGNVWDNAAIKSFFSSLKTERIGKKLYRTRAQAKADVCDYIECLYNPTRRHSTLGYLSPVDFEGEAGGSLNEPSSVRIKPAAGQKLGSRRYAKFIEYIYFERFLNTGYRPDHQGRARSRTRSTAATITQNTASARTE